MKYLEEKEFRILIGIKLEIFEKMLEILSDADRKKKARCEAKSKGSTALVTLEYRAYK